MTTSLLVDDIMHRSGVAFGTSGARGRVVDMTDLVCYVYARGFLSYLISIGEYQAGQAVALAGDLRPSTPRIMAACAAAVIDLGGEPVNCGFVPTPAMADYAFARGIPSIMVTGSHIPDDRNGIKFYRPAGEVLKSDEADMKQQAVPIAPDRFGEDGMLIVPPALSAPTDAGALYVQRYLDFYGPDALRGLRIGVFQHSAVGRDILMEIVTALGGEATALGRSERFIPVDTEAIRPEDVASALGWAAEYGFDAIISTDGDSDRPLLANRDGVWLRGDMLGILCARAVGASTVVTPVSSNSALELSGWFAQTARTRIGSPYVIAAMQEALARGDSGVCGYEANGGFLLASPVTREGRTLGALPTRDAVLPIIATIIAARPGPLTALEAQLPPRVTHSDRIVDFPVAQSQALVAHLLAGSAADQRERLQASFGALGGTLTEVDLTDGIRMTFDCGVIIHLRPSGNAPELRCYTEANDLETARTLNEQALALVRDELAPRAAAG